MSMIEEGKGVILKKGKNIKYICASNKIERIEKFNFDCSCLIGKRYGSAFLVNNDKKLEVINPVLLEEHADGYFNANSEADAKPKDNRNIEDISESQKLSKEDIMSFQEEGWSGEKIIQELVDNSATFHERTEFSKAKYLQKKKKKYVAQFLALKPTARLLAQMYFYKNPAKILYIRPDTVAQILTRGNIQSGSNVLLLENCQGFIGGSILERLGSAGKLIQCYRASFPVRIIMEQFNFSAATIEKMVCSFPLDKILLIEDLFQCGKSDEEIVSIILGGSQVDVTKKIENQPVEMKNDISEGDSAVSEKKEGANDNIGNKRKLEDSQNDRGDWNRVAYISREQRLKEFLESLNYIREKKIDSVVIVSKYHPKNILLKILEFLPPSCPFVVYFTHQEPLMECYVTLRSLNLACNLELTQSWLRHIQVLPNRTHPDNVMSGSGGYLLHGVKIES